MGCIDKGAAKMVEIIGVSEEIVGRRGPITSFGIDAGGKVYMMTAAGPVYRLEPVR